MSAIWGIINKDGKPVEPGIVQQIKSTMQHRAKDGSKELICGNAAFGFCHLVVYPNQENEQLPIEDGELVFTANAHLHNRDELLHKLGYDKKQYAATPDSYLILAAYKKWGNDCVHHLDGEYVYAVWNKLSQELFLASDHIGFKPVFFYDTRENFIFCSEIKGIEAIKQTPNYFDEQSLVECFFKNGDPKCTYNKEIKRLCGGNSLLVSLQGLKISRYWRLEATGKYRSMRFDDCAQQVRELMFNATSARLNPERPVGILLSGGLDSSSVACILSAILKEKNKPLYAFSSVESAASGQMKRSEQHYIKMVQEHCGNIIQTNVVAEYSNPFAALDKAFEMDEGFSNLFHYMDAALREAAREKHINNLFSGFGGDFLVSKKGSTAVHQMINSFNLSKALALMKKLGSKQNKGLYEIIRAYYITHTWPAKKYREISYLRIEDYLQRPLLKKNKVFNSLSNRGTAHLISIGKPAEWCGTQDNAGEYYNLSTAMPLFDRHIADLLVNVPEEFFLHEGLNRSVIRRAMDGVLPKDIQWRDTKSPFVVDYEKRIISHISKAGFSFADTHPFNLYFKTRPVQQIINDTQEGKPLSFRTELRDNRAGLLLMAGMMVNHITNKNYKFSFGD